MQCTRRIWDSQMFSVALSPLVLAAREHHRPRVSELPTKAMRQNFKDAPVDTSHCSSALAAHSGSGGASHCP